MMVPGLCVLGTLRLMIRKGRVGNHLLVMRFLIGQETLHREQARYPSILA
jgi:hypothetical protein